MKIALPLLVAVLTWSPLPAQSANSSATPRPIWSWTAEERVAARLDAAARNTRIDAALAHRKRPTSAADRPTDVIRGTDHPELLLPHEIFSTFTRAAYASVDDATSAEFRRQALQKAQEVGLPSDFLDVLEATSRDFLTLQRREIALRDSLGRGASEPRTILAEAKRLEAAECPLRAAAIRQLRARYGTRFDQFLYTAIAPGVFYDFFEPQTASGLLAQERGCP